MRKVKFTHNGNEIQGYFVGIAGVVYNGSGYGGDSLLIVEDEEGKVYSVNAEYVQFLSKPAKATYITEQINHLVNCN